MTWRCKEPGHQQPWHWSSACPFIARKHEITGEPLNLKSRILAPNWREMTGVDCIVQYKNTCQTMSIVDNDGLVFSARASVTAMLIMHTCDSSCSSVESSSLKFGKCDGKKSVKCAWKYMYMNLLWRKSIENFVCNVAAILFRPECVNPLRLNVAIWQNRSGSILAQVIACGLTAPNHYLNQCWLIITKAQWNSSESNFTKIPQSSFNKIGKKIA